MESSQQKEKLRDKIQGIIFGAALGDAFGLATEFMNKETARKLYGDGPIKFGLAKGHEFYRDGHRCRWHENDFTDDTDQMLLILQCLLSSDGLLIPQEFAYSLKEWTEIGFPELDNKTCCGVGFTVGCVIGHTQFETNPHKAALDIWQANDRNLAANGAVMRTSVLGISLFHDESHVVRNAANCAKVTHADPRCIFSAVVVSVLISRMLRMEIGSTRKYNIPDSEKEKLLKLINSDATENYDEPTGTALKSILSPKSVQKDKSRNILQSLWSPIARKFVKKPAMGSFSLPSHRPIDPLRIQTPAVCSNDPDRFSTTLCGQNDLLMRMIEEVVSDYSFLIDKQQTQWNADVERMCPPKNLHDLQLDERRSIGYTLKCVGSALFCFSRNKADDMKSGDFFIRIITDLTLEAGDADTNAAVAGALLGCRLGFKGLPSQWLNGLRHRKFLMEICDELLELVMKQLSKSKQEIHGAQGL
ncbi:uncharacterized protein LOC119082395 [Bradysia coprophila]|uniref:uncharacterized protein LOC119082395 n=1 Tax=Bradysia coprophila TaxID=38358 RepID=UPI00187D9D94|nr:uncharacterized protein LOC119082395 [Bradysia coprophila]